MSELKRMAESADEAQGLEELLGIEGNAARIYFGAFAGMIKADEETGTRTGVQLSILRDGTGGLRGMR